MLYLEQLSQKRYFIRARKEVYIKFYELLIAQIIYMYVRSMGDLRI